jgi:hypothetical protein
MVLYSRICAALSIPRADEYRFKQMPESELMSKLEYWATVIVSELVKSEEAWSSVVRHRDHRSSEYQMLMLRTLRTTAGEDTPAN